MKLNFDNPQILKSQIGGLQQTTGLCMFIDICNSTAIKKKDIKEWLLLIGNTIRLCSGTFPLFSDNVLKLIGDEIMIFIPDDKIEKENETYATILDQLKACIIACKEFSDNNVTLKVKAAIHNCSNCYNVSYNNHDDFYGNDIDLTARFMKKSEENKIVLSETFFQIVYSIEPSFLEDCSEKMEDEFKGIDGKIGFRLLN